jgi:hypothetical protein
MGQLLPLVPWLVAGVVVLAAAVHYATDRRADAAKEAEMARLRETLIAKDASIEALDQLLNRAQIAAMPPSLSELSQFIVEERMRFDTRDNNLFSTSFSAIGRYHSFLQSIVERHRAASAAMMANTRAMYPPNRPSGIRQFTDAEMRLHEDAVRFQQAVQLEEESFYLFAKMLLDKVAQAVGFYFGPARGCSTKSHDDFTKCIRRYCELKGLELSDDLVAHVEHLKSDVADSGTSKLVTRPALAPCGR